MVSVSWWLLVVVAMLLRSGARTRSSAESSFSVSVSRSQELSQGDQCRRRISTTRRMGGYLSSSSDQADVISGPVSRRRDFDTPALQREAPASADTSRYHFGLPDRRWQSTRPSNRRRSPDRSINCGPVTVIIHEMTCGIWSNRSLTCRAMIKGIGIGAVLVAFVIGAVYGVVYGNGIWLGGDKGATVKKFGSSESSTQFSVKAEISRSDTSGFVYGSEYPKEKAEKPTGGLPRKGGTLNLEEFVCRAVDSVLWCYHALTRRCVKLLSSRGHKPDTVTARLEGIAELPMCRGFSLYVEI